MTEGHVTPGTRLAHAWHTLGTRLAQDEEGKTAVTTTSPQQTSKPTRPAHVARAMRLMALVGPVSGVLLALSTVAPGRAQESGFQSVLAPLADAYVRSGKSSRKNFGGEPVLQVRKTGDVDGRRASYLLFDLGSIAGPVESASLRVYGYYTGRRMVTGRALAAQSTSWVEQTITWDSRPEFTPELYGTTTWSTTPAWHTFDVTALVQAKQGELLTLVLQNATRSPYRVDLSALGSINPPELVVRSQPGFGAGGGREGSESDKGETFSPEEEVPSEEVPPEEVPPEELPPGEVDGGQFPNDVLGAARGGMLINATDGMGVSIGVTPGDVRRYADEIQAAGFKWVRTRLHWAGIERSQGVFNWKVAPDYDRIVNEFNRRGIGVLFVLSLSNNDVYPGLAGRPPFNGAGRQNLASFARAAAARYAGSKVIFELGNEPNIRNFWPIDQDRDNAVTRQEFINAAQAYSDLAHVVVPAMRAPDGDPDAYVIGPSLAGRGGRRFGDKRAAHIYMEKLRDEGSLEPLFNRVAVHLYTAEGTHPRPNMPAGSAPEDVEIDLYRDLIADPQANMFNTERGWKSDGSALEDRLQASFNVRDFLFGLSRGVRFRVWFLWDGPGGRADWSVRGKPAARAAAVLEQELGGFQYVRRIATDNPHHYVFEYRNAQGDTRLAAWKARTDTPGGYEHPSAEDATVVSLLGDVSTSTSDGSMIRLSLDIHPVYVDLEP